ncbi:MAG: hypothetical protein V7604_2566, partial [Hyphomicrobiales bacterium]
TLARVETGELTVEAAARALAAHDLECDTGPSQHVTISKQNEPVT